MRVQFSKDSGSIISPFADKKLQPKPCDCAIDHNGWVDAHEMTITIYLGGEDLDLDDLCHPWSGLVNRWFDSRFRRVDQQPACGAEQQHARVEEKGRVPLVAA